ncbi:MAG: hypothetical protein D6714_14865 [Bacteroidetes bacterium]|nr:MAG: hypothetical protein D6714_14865 [Bacteroidota bacterium]
MKVSCFHSLFAQTRHFARQTRTGGALVFLGKNNIRFQPNRRLRMSGFFDFSCVRFVGKKCSEGSIQWAVFFIRPKPAPAKAGNREPVPIAQNKPNHSFFPQNQPPQRDTRVPAKKRNPEPSFRKFGTTFLFTATKAVGNDRSRR